MRKQKEVWGFHTRQSINNFTPGRKTILTISAFLLSTFPSASKNLSGWNVSGSIHKSSFINTAYVFANTGVPCNYISAKKVASLNSSFMNLEWLMIKKMLMVSLHHSLRPSHSPLWTHSLGIRNRWQLCAQLQLVLFERIYELPKLLHKCKAYCQDKVLSNRIRTEN